MKRIIAIFLLLIVSVSVYAQKRDSLSIGARYTISALEGQLYNLSFYSFDRYILKAEYAQVSCQTIKRNLEFGTGWDHDVVGVNMIGHPVQGGLDHIINRLNGLGFWQSFPLVFLESATWELFAETEPPSPNDFFTTSWNGLVLGEAAWRSFNYAFRKDSRKGVSFEMKAGLGTRMVVELSHSIPHAPYKMAAGIGGSVSLDIIYGDQFSLRDNSPVSFFDLRMVAAAGSGQSPISEFTFLGRLWGAELDCKKGEAVFGIYDHMSTFLAESWTENRAPYRCSEACSIGPGIVYSNKGFTTGAYLSATVIGAGTTDYYDVYDRDYNFGSGYSFKSLNSYRASDVFSVELGLRHYQIFTFWGDRPTDVPDKHYINSQGDNGTTLTEVVNLKTVISPVKHLSIDLCGMIIHRNSFYAIHPAASATHLTAELSLKYCL